MQPTGNEQPGKSRPQRHLDPSEGEAIPFRLVGRRWFLGNRPARVASEIIEESGRIVVIEDGDGEMTVLKDKAA